MKVYIALPIDRITQLPWYAFYCFLHLQKSNIIYSPTVFIHLLKCFVVAGKQRILYCIILLKLIRISSQILLNTVIHISGFYVKQSLTLWLKYLTYKVLVRCLLEVIRERFVVFMFPLHNCSAAVCVVVRVVTVFPAFSDTDLKAAPHFCSQSKFDRARKNASDTLRTKLKLTPSAN